MNPYQQPYFGRQIYGYNPYQVIGQPMPQQQPIVQQQPIQPIGLQGKSVDSIDVVKAMDIPLDGSISYFPTTDGAAIVTKQLQKDGTSRTIIYKPSITNENAPQSNLNSSETSYIKEELKSIKNQIQSIANSLKGVDKNESNGNVAECNNEQQ